MVGPCPAPPCPVRGHRSLPRASLTRYKTAQADRIHDQLEAALESEKTQMLDAADAISTNGADFSFKP